MAPQENMVKIYASHKKCRDFTMRKKVYEGMLLITTVSIVHTYPGSTFHADVITSIDQYIIYPEQHSPHTS